MDDAVHVLRIDYMSLYPTTILHANLNGDYDGDEAMDDEHYENVINYTESVDEEIEHVDAREEENTCTNSSRNR